MNMMPITSTVRLQLHHAFTLDDATLRVPYFAGLGVSHLYLSPLVRSITGSMHGYDVVDYEEINPELGGLPALERLVTELRRYDMGLIVDIVPNHMAAKSPENRWWRDVLCLGPDSRFKDFFDIDWDSPDSLLRGKVLLPVLGQQYGVALASGDIRLAFDGEREEFEIQYFAHRLPLAPVSYGEILRTLDGSRADRALPSGGYPRASAAFVPLDSGALLLQLGETSADAAANRAFGLARILSAYAPQTEVGQARLHALLEIQNYRLAWWRSARDEINWRRFFEISDLVGMRVELESVFEATHGLMFQLYKDGLIDGLRVDHVDGLANPGGYCQALRERLASLRPYRPEAAGRDEPYVIVEKILADGETLRTDWGIDGTTGYDFMNAALRLLVDGRAEQSLTRLWQTISLSHDGFDAYERAARRQILSENLASELDAVARLLHELARSSPATRDFSLTAVRRVTAAFLCELRVYRTYIFEQAFSAADRLVIGRTVARARRILRISDHALLDALAGWILQKNTLGSRLATGRAVTRLQQTSSPLAAKAVEDTAFYRYGRLLALNEVGGNPAVFALEAPAFHDRTLRRSRDFPLAMNATATHDHKRGEDVRARLAVLSECSSDWTATLLDWHRRAVPHRAMLEAGLAPDFIDEAMLFQTLVGAWPLDLAPDDICGTDAFLSRIAVWQTKALHEAKRYSSWIAANPAYESACTHYLQALKAAQSPDLTLGEIAQFAREISVAGAVNGLAQCFLRMTTPGIPDLYQGTERWDFSLVDPDNRRAVDYEIREKALAHWQEDPKWENLLLSWRDGRVKQALIARVLTQRRQRPELFRHGNYEPLQVRGPLARCVIAFRRRSGSDVAICILTRLAHPYLEGEQLRIAPAQWQDTHVVTGDDSSATLWRDALTGQESHANHGDVLLSQALRELPVALLLGQRTS